MHSLCHKCLPTQSKKNREIRKNLVVSLKEKFYLYNFQMLKLSRQNLK